MKIYHVTGKVFVDVEISIKAESAEAAKALYFDRMMITASLADTPGEVYEVSEDSIEDIEDVEVEDESDV